MELLTQANAILGQMSLAKYLLIATNDDSPGLDLNRRNSPRARIVLIPSSASNSPTSEPASKTA